MSESNSPSIFLVHFTYGDPPVHSYKEMLEMHTPYTRLDDAIHGATIKIEEYLKDEYWDVKSIIPKEYNAFIGKHSYVPLFEINTRKLRRRVDVPYIRVWIQKV